jgi:hypothetical protein
MISFSDQRVQDLHDDDKQERRQRITLSEAASMEDVMSKPSFDEHLGASHG